MWWVFSVVFMAWFAVSGYQKAKATGQWKLSRFGLALGFAVFEGLLICAPIFLMNLNLPYFLWVWGATGVAAIVLMIWFALWARRWTRGNG